MAKSEQVDHPDHYNQGGIECIDAIEAALGPEGYIAWLRGTIIKYHWRLGHKDAAGQDAAKADWYSKRLVEALADTIEAVEAPDIAVGTESFTLAECPAGIFLTERGHYGFKSEYQTRNERSGLCQHDAYCLESGEYFWGGANGDIAARENIRVFPVSIAPRMPPVEVADHD